MTESSYGNGGIQMPNSIVCYSFVNSGRRLTKSAWLVPHIFAHYGERDVVYWRCSWGHMCESDCLYALLRPSRERRPTAVIDHADGRDAGLIQDAGQMRDSQGHVAAQATRARPRTLVE